jgi:hypothetical protein
VSAIAAASTHAYVNTHPTSSALSAPALDHGFQTGLYALMGLLLFGAVLVATLVRPAPAPAAVEPDAIALEEAA